MDASEPTLEESHVQKCDRCTHRGTKPESRPCCACFGPEFLGFVEDKKKCETCFYRVSSSCGDCHAPEFPGYTQGPCMSDPEPTLPVKDLASADQSHCPKCEDIQSKLIDNLKGQYGKLPVDEFLKVVAEAEEKGAFITECTLNQSWNNFTEKGILHISYRAGCTECGFTFKYEKKLNILTGRYL